MCRYPIQFYTGLWFSGGQADKNKTDIEQQHVLHEFLVDRRGGQNRRDILPLALVRVSYRARLVLTYLATLFAGQQR